MQKNHFKSTTEFKAQEIFLRKPAHTGENNQLYVWISNLHEASLRLKSFYFENIPMACSGAEPGRDNLQIKLTSLLH